MALDLANLRREYTRAGLSRNDLHEDPINQFSQWLEQMVNAGIPDANAMTIATVDATGQPSQRIVLLKSFDPKGFIFFTNLNSRKAQELDLNAKISLHFPWHMLERQVHVCGVVEQLSRNEVTEYFFNRPRESQIAAWVSKQSRPIASRALLMERFESMKHKFANNEIPVPDFWGGFRVKPHQIEFWQGGPHRLHDRFQYYLGTSGHWQIQRLEP